MNKLHELMQKEMTRKEFLATVGLGVASIFGLGTLIKLLSGKDQANQPYGYGNGAYGGSRKS